LREKEKWQTFGVRHDLVITVIVLDFIDVKARAVAHDGPLEKAIEGRRKVL